MNAESSNWNERIFGVPLPRIPGQFNVGDACVLTGLCQMWDDCTGGDYYQCGYQSSQLAMDTTVGVGIAAATGGIGTFLSGLIRGLSAFTKAVPDVDVPSPKSGETPHTIRGKDVHKQFGNFLADMRGQGYRGPTTLSSGKRVDGIYIDPNSGQRIPVELKPNNWRKIREGWNQLAEYEQELGAPAGSGQLWVYDIGPSGEIYFTRVL